MSQNKYYYYDHETMSFVEAAPIQRNNPLRWGAIAVGAATLLIAVGIWAFSSIGGGSAKEYQLKSENEALRTQLGQTEKRVDAVFDKLDELYKKDSELYRVVLQVDPISKDVRDVGVGGTDTYESFDGYSNETGGLLRRMNTTLDKLERQMSLQGSSYRELITIARTKNEDLAHKPIMIPVEGGRFTSGFGYRFHPIARTRRMHEGVDIVVPIGTPIYAPANGTVDFAATKGGYGHTVVLKHGNSGYSTLFAHLSRYVVSQGQTVKRGQLIAYSGNSGSSTGPHLHYEVQSADGQQKFNPMDFIAPSMSPKALKEAIKGAEGESASLDF